MSKIDLSTDGLNLQLKLFAADYLCKPSHMNHPASLICFIAIDYALATLSTIRHVQKPTIQRTLKCQSAVGADSSRINLIPKAIFDDLWSENASENKKVFIHSKLSPNAHKKNQQTNKQNKTENGAIQFSLLWKIITSNLKLSHTLLLSVSLSYTFSIFTSSLFSPIPLFFFTLLLNLSIITWTMGLKKLRFDFYISYFLHRHVKAALCWIIRFLTQSVEWEKIKVRSYQHTT